MKVKKLFGNLFKWEPQKITITGLLLGLIMVALSVALIYLPEGILTLIIIRDLLMILLCGIGIPLFIINKEKDLHGYGLHLKKWYLFLPVNLLLGFLLLLVFLKESPLPASFSFTGDLVWKIVFLMLAGIFEMITFYSFIRTAIERSLGIIPAILIAAIFYSLHHAGFQPEFGKLLFVGILYATVFRIGNSALLIYPFFWGVGGCYDVLVQSQEASEIVYPELRSVILLIGIGLVLIYLKLSVSKTTDLPRSSDNFSKS